jgi:hypothetical protein
MKKEFRMYIEPELYNEFMEYLDKGAYDRSKVLEIIIKDFLIKKEYLK